MSFFDHVPVFLATCKNWMPAFRDVGTIMRYLGQFPSETDVVEVVLREIQEDDSNTVVTYPAFEKMMLRFARQGF